MPVCLPPLAQLTDLVARAAADSNSSAPSAVANGTASALQVVCAWPVSGQYGPGSRILYYVLVAAGVFGQEVDWLRSACLAALLFPAVAAIHGIVLAALHVDGAVDMDVFGAFQLCSIGILAAPVTVRQSRRYFYDPGRNLIFLWTGLVLAGMLSLTVEFFRASPTPCPLDDAGNPVSPRPNQFPYDDNPSCGLVCVPNGTPDSPLRRDAANDVFVIPAPDRLDFGTAALLAAACCIPPVLLLISTFNKILEINFKNRRHESGEAGGDETASADATGPTSPNVSSNIRRFLTAIEIPFFGGMVIILVIIGERNFWSPQVRYQTEPIASIGQWAPIVGTGLGVLGSLYVIFVAPLLQVVGSSSDGSSELDSYPQHDARGRKQRRSPPGDLRPPHSTSPRPPPRALNGLGPAHLQLGISGNHDPDGPEGDGPATPGTARDYGGRRRFAKGLHRFANFLDNAANTFDDSAFRGGRAADFPTVPGEGFRNPELRGIEDIYNPARDQQGAAIPGSSRAHSIAPSVASGQGRASGDGEEHHVHRRVTSASSVGMVGPLRRDTLTVPSRTSYGPARRSVPASPDVDIVVSFDHDPSPMREVSGPESPTVWVESPTAMAPPSDLR